MKTQEKNLYGMDWLSESFWQGATQLDNQIRSDNWE